MMLISELICLAVLITLVQPTLLTDIIQKPDSDQSVDAEYHDLISDPNYDVLVSWHLVNPDSHPRETWRDVLAELQFGPSLAERAAEAVPNVDNGHKLDLPTEFDARKHWKKCKRIIGTVYDQGPCLSDYAIAAASVLADRLCIYTNGKVRSLLSAQTVLGCYGSCQGGYIYAAFSYVNNTGIPTGGTFKPKKGCVPFEPTPCKHNTSPSQGSEGEPESSDALPNCSDLTPGEYVCPYACTNQKYKKKMDKDLHRSIHFNWTTTKESQIREEILEHGSVGAAFTMYSDFKNYHSGIYTRSPSSTYEYIHKIKLIGWGVENGTDYWLAANSYNKKWGEHGLVKFPRGINYLYIETLVVFSIPFIK